MALSDKQIKLAKRIDDHAKKVFAAILLIGSRQATDYLNGGPYRAPLNRHRPSSRRFTYLYVETPKCPRY